MRQQSVCARRYCYWQICHANSRESNCLFFKEAATTVWFYRAATPDTDVTVKNRLIGTFFLARRWFRARFCCPSQRNRCDKERRKKRWCWQSILAVNNYCETVVCKVISFKTYLKLRSVSETSHFYLYTHNEYGASNIRNGLPLLQPVLPLILVGWKTQLLW